MYYLTNCLRWYCRPFDGLIIKNLPRFTSGQAHAKLCCMIMKGDFTLLVSQQLPRSYLDILCEMVLRAQLINSDATLACYAVECLAYCHLVET